jgi:phosphoglycolate phosphatase-like HAD superfamily hydrolase
MSATLAFDFDGTIVDCRPRQLAALERALGAPPPDPDGFWAAKRAGRTTAEALRRLGLDDSRAEEVAARWVEIVEDDDLLGHDRPLPGAAEALRAARRAGRRLVLLTARRRAAAVGRQLAALGLYDHFDAVAVVPPAEAAPAKAQLLRAERAATFIGDTESDAAAARMAQVPFLAVTGGQRSADYLERRVGCPLYPDLPAAVRAAVGEEST